MVERFIAPVLKTGDPLRGPGVRIPLPLRTKSLPNGRLFLFKDIYKSRERDENRFETVAEQSEV